VDVVRRADVCDLPAVFAGRSLKRVAAHADVVPAPDAVAPVPAIRSSTCPSIVNGKACGVTVTDAQICSQFTRATVPSDVKELLDMLDTFGKAEPPDA
jgi:hypothetical protein